MLELNEEKEYGCVGAGIGSGIHNTHHLKVLSIEEALASEDCQEWGKSVQHEHNQMTTNGVWEVVNQNDIPKDADIINSTWVIQFPPEMVANWWRYGGKLVTK